jgi:NAD+ diphosphatase
MIYCPKCGQELSNQERGGKERRVCPDKSCGYVYWNNPIPVVGAIVEREGADKLIMVQSIGWPKTFYALVTGFLEHKETPEEAVLREVQEEIGLTGTIGSFVGMYPFYQRNQLLLIYHVTVGPGEVKLDEEELADYREVPLAEVQPWPAGTGIALQEWLHSRGYEKELKPFPRP